MPVTLLASACPAPKSRTTLKTIAAANNNTGATVITAQKYNTGDGPEQFSPRFNMNAAQIELLGAYGGGAYAIIQGLAISAGSGLTLNIAAGQALIDGIVEKEASTLALLDNTARLWIWVQQDGTLSYTTSTTAPSAVSVLLGSAVTSGGAITSVDTSGVLYLRGGIPYRESADTGQPSDTPPSTLLHFIKTGGGTYFWDGTAYGQLITGTRQAYTATNVTTDRSFDANATTLDEVADVLGTLIADLRAKGLVA